MDGKKQLDRTITRKDKMLEYLRKGGSDPKLDELFEQYQDAHGMLKHNSRLNACALFMEKYKVSRSKAYQMLQETEYIFGIAHQVDKDFQRNLQIEALQMDIQIARENKDNKAIAMLSKELRLWTMSKDDSLNPNDLQVHNQFIQINVEGNELVLPLEKLLKLSEKEISGLNKAANGDYAEWEEIEAMIDGKEK